MFEEKIGVTKNGVKKLVRSKNNLEVFLPVRGRPGRPNYSSKKIMDEVKKRLKKNSSI
jgi:3-deoxy-D-arabino-heptulosonate 7-phosphate (DAHP) synthase